MNAPTVTLTESLWSGIANIHAAILGHPFVTGLADGTLAHAAFRHYIVQDAHYLRSYSRALAVCAAKAPTADDTVMFAEHAGGAIAAERALHAVLLADLGLDAEAATAEPVAPTTVAYTSYLLATCYGGSFAEGLAAVLPCYWIYARVGAALVERGSPDPLYARWIAMYGGDEFQSVVESVLALTDRIGPTLSGTERALAHRHFTTTSRYEWMFWDAGYRQETWPV
ncbi:MAG: thiaminase II [Pseudonocardia sp.]